jgi:hypothetical protein
MDRRQTVAPMRHYFDTDVFGNFLDGSQADERRVGDAKTSGLIEIVLSVLNLEEVMAAEARNPDRYRRLVRLILHWSNQELLVKPIEMLLKDDIASYARNGQATCPFVSGEMLDTLRRGMNAFLSDRSPEGVIDRLETSLKAHEQNRSFKAALDAVLPEIKAAAEQQKSQGIQPTFDAFFSDASKKIAASFAKKCDVLDECTSRDLTGLLGLRSVRAAAGIFLSTVYAFAFEGRKDVDLGDNRDIHHFTLASAATGAFVTDDRSLVYRARRVPIDSMMIRTRCEMLATLPPPRASI